MTELEKQNLKLALLQDSLVINMVQTLGALQAAQAGYPTSGNEQVLYNPTSKITEAVDLASQIFTSFYTSGDESEVVRKLAIKWMINDFETLLSAYADHENLIMYDDHQWGEE